MNDVNFIMSKMISYNASRNCMQLMDFCEITMEKKEIQRNRIKELLFQRPTSCNEFLKLGIAQYNTRIFELRKLGYKINYNSYTKKFEMIS